MGSWGVCLSWFDCNKVYVVSEQKCVYQWLIVDGEHFNSISIIEQQSNAFSLPSCT